MINFNDKLAHIIKDEKLYLLLKERIEVENIEQLRFIMHTFLDNYRV